MGLCDGGARRSQPGVDGGYPAVRKSDPVARQWARRAYVLRIAARSTVPSPAVFDASERTMRRASVPSVRMASITLG